MNKNLKGSNEQIELEIEKLRMKARSYASMSKLFLILFVISIVFTAIIAIADNTSAMLYLLAPIVSVMAVLWFLTGEAQKKLEKKMTLHVQDTDIMAKLFKEVFTVYKYEKANYISEAVYRASNFRSNFDRYKGNDYLHASYNGVDFEFSDINIGKTRSVGEHYTTDILFEGFWIVIPIKHRINDTFIFWGRQEHDNNQSKFEERFHIKTNNIESTLKILDVSFQNDIMLLSDRLRDEENNWQLSMSFQENCVHIGVNSLRDNFELSINKSENLNEIENRFRSELAVIIDILKTLAPNISRIR